MKPATRVRAELAPKPVGADVALGDKAADARLVRECLEGRNEAWSALIAKYKRLIYSIPIKHGLTGDEAADIFQEVCVELLSELSRLREPRALPKWLIQVTSHKCARLQRQRRARARAMASGDDRRQDVADDRGYDPLAREIEREQALRNAVAALPPRCQRLVRSLFFESPPRPYREIAGELGIASGSIGFIRGRCLERLRRELEKYGF